MRGSEGKGTGDSIVTHIQPDVGIASDVRDVDIARHRGLDRESESHHPTRRVEGKDGRPRHDQGYTPQ